MSEFATVPIAVLGGSGAYNLLATQALGKEKHCQAIETPYGNSAPIHHFSFKNLDFLKILIWRRKSMGKLIIFVSFVFFHEFNDVKAITLIACVCGNLRRQTVTLFFTEFEIHKSFNIIFLIIFKIKLDSN